MKEQKIISSWVPNKARVLDLGCGDGDLLAYLAKEKGVTGYGLEISKECIFNCVAKGVSVIEQNFDAGLKNFPSRSFDLVLLTHTLQTPKRPDKLLEEMLRVGGQAIVTFYNFSHWKNRWYLGWRGEMPISKYLPYSWYDTPNIHHCTISDFTSLCRAKGFRILDKRFSGLGRATGLRPNFFAANAMYLLGK